MHFVMMISNEDQKGGMFKWLENTVKSIKFFSHEQQEIFFTVVLQGESKNYPHSFGFENLNLVNQNEIISYYSKTSSYLMNNVEFYYCDSYWELGMPCRWFVKPRSKICCMIDVDMIACNNLSPLYSLDKEFIHGALARNARWIHTKEKVAGGGVDEKNLLKIGLSISDLEKYYLNFGLVVVPSCFLRIVGEELFSKYRWFKQNIHNYYAGQFALAHTLKDLDLPLNLLPDVFNYYDKDPVAGRESDILFLHIMQNRGSICGDFSGVNGSFIKDITRTFSNSKRIFI